MRAASTLPSGFPEARFRAVTGHVELAVAEAAHGSGPRPQRVTALLAALCETLDGAPCDAALLRRVSVAGRERLLIAAGLQFYEGSNWFEATCNACEARFDLQCDLASVPTSEAGEGFPVASVGERQFEAPNGGHEEALAASPGVDPLRQLAALCDLGEPTGYSAEELGRIDAALEDISPEIAGHIDAACPECGAPTRLAIDPLGFAFPAPARLLREVCAIARETQWSEEAILALPSDRRKAYAQMLAPPARRRAAA